MKTIQLIISAFLVLPISLYAQMPGMGMSKPAAHKNKAPFEISGRQDKTLSEEHVAALLAKQNKNKIIVFW